MWDQETRRFLPKDVHRVAFGPISNPDLQPTPQRVDWYGAGDIEAEMEPEFLSLDWLLDLHEETCRAGRLTMARKNHDYTNGSTDIFANFEGSTIFGIHPVHGILLRTTDKLKRIETFVSKGELAVAGEGVDDAIEDAINYLVLIKGLIRKAQGE